jgi:NADP-dependent 3-hydroxy acid dehydrogenase YdfG
MLEGMELRDATALVTGATGGLGQAITAPGIVMVQRRRGQLAFISSISGNAATVGRSVYSVSKFGRRGFALGLRLDLAPHGGLRPPFVGWLTRMLGGAKVAKQIADRQAERR